MPKLPRYRTGDPELDESIRALVDEVAAGEVDDLVFELVVSAIRLARERASRGDLKIANTALKELRYAFHVFGPYRQERKVSIFGSARVQKSDPLYTLTRDLARAFVERDWMVITGAGPGIMTAGIEGAGAEHSFGVSIRLPFETTTSQFIADDPKLVNFRYFFTRKLTFVKESAGFVLMPGGFGTMDEAFELLTLVQTGKGAPAPIVMLDEPGGRYWQRWHDFIAELVSERYIKPEDQSLYRFTDSIEVAVDECVGFYSNYHSIRFVDDRLIIRLQRAPSTDRVVAINDAFGDIVTGGRIEIVETTDDEQRDRDVPELARLGLRFNRSSWSRLRHLIDVLNDRARPTPISP